MWCDGIVLECIPTFVCLHVNAHILIYTFRVFPHYQYVTLVFLLLVGWPTLVGMQVLRSSREQTSAQTLYLLYGGGVPN